MLSSSRKDRYDQIMREFSGRSCVGEIFGQDKMERKEGGKER